LDWFNQVQKVRMAEFGQALWIFLKNCDNVVPLVLRHFLFIEDFLFENENRDVHHVSIFLLASVDLPQIVKAPVHVRVFVNLVILGELAAHYF
jgi:hypothetical protein